MSDVVTLQAQLDAANQRIVDLESQMDTIPCKPPEDTGPVSDHDMNKAMAAIAIRDAVDQLSETQRAMELAEFKAHQAMGIAADEEAARTPTRMERIEAKLDALEKRVADELAELRENLAGIERAVTAASANIDTLVGTLQPFGTRLTLLEGAHTRNHPVHLAVAPPPSSKRPGALETEAQEG